MSFELSFDKVNKIIEVKQPATEVTVQDLYNKIRDWEEETNNLEVDKICDCYGKQELGGGVKVGLTLVLYDWKLKFEERTSQTICIVSGGNLVRYDTQTQTYEFPLEYSSNVMGYVARSSSATLQELAMLQHSSYNNGVTIDVVNGEPGTEYPIGTLEQPVNNLADAKTIAEERGFDTLYIIGNITFGATDDISGFNVIGQNSFLTTITIEAGCTTIGANFQSCKIKGVLDGLGCSINNKSRIGNLSGFFGYMDDCSLEGTLTLAGSGTIFMFNCVDGFVGL
ncbi:MAG: hypothetical protein DRP09_15705, partial [Candidatus Thorarchaeota archaeon]